MKTDSRTKFAIAIVSIIATGTAAADAREVEPSPREIEYMETLDTDLGETLGGNDNVDVKTIETDSGERRIIMDYSESDGAVITPD